MRTFSTSPRELAAGIWRYRELMLVFIKRDILGRYKGSILGLFWSFFHPLLMLAVYTFVFSVVFQARWAIGSDTREDFALILFAGLIVFNLFSECVNRAPGLIVSHSNYVKRVIFPLEILPCMIVGSALIHSLVSLFVWLLAYGVLMGLPAWPALLVPLAVLPLLLSALGVCWFLSALGVYLRDIAQLVSVFTTALLFLSPVFYPSSALPAPLQGLMLLNPVAPAIEYVRALLLEGSIPPIGDWLTYLFCGALVAWLGFAWFQKTRKGFADVL